MIFHLFWIGLLFMICQGFLYTNTSVVSEGDFNVEERKKRLAEIGLFPYSLDKINSRRREILIELRGLTEIIVRAYEAGELN